MTYGLGSGSKQFRGGKYATPIRLMLENNKWDGVIFYCKDEKHANKVRVSSLVLKARNDYTYKTSVRDNRAMIFKRNRVWGDTMMSVDLTHDEEEETRI